MDGGAAEIILLLVLLLGAGSLIGVIAAFMRAKEMKED